MDTKLQVISGNLRGRKLSLPVSARPTQNCARLAIFNMLDGLLDFSHALVAWDAFAGSGALGIEFLSKYNNSKVLFTDLSPDTTKIITKNLNGIAAQRFSVFCGDAISFVQKYAKNVDVVFVDAPYDTCNTGIDFVKKMDGLVKSGTIIVQEIESSVDYMPEANYWDVLRDKTYGRARFLILQRKTDK